MTQEKKDRIMAIAFSALVVSLSIIVTQPGLLLFSWIRESFENFLRGSENNHPDGNMLVIELLYITHVCFLIAYRKSYRGVLLIILFIIDLVISVCMMYGLFVGHLIMHSMDNFQL